MSLTDRIKAEAKALGFAQAGILPAGPSLTHPFYEAWLGQGFAGEMGYLERHSPLKKNLTSLLPGARSAILLTLNYQSPPPEPPGGGLRSKLRGRVSRYAWGRDYHGLIGEKLRALATFIGREAARPVRSRPFVDTAPVMEREFAARAGLGWIGKHGVLIHWRLGSWLFLAGLLVDIPLQYDGPRPPRKGSRGLAAAPPDRSLAVPPLHEAGKSARGRWFPGLEMRESCGSCTACMDACPTGAIVAEKTVDSRRCISYHTIELKGAIPHEFRRAAGEWIFGCDICQDVCPWNRKAPLGDEREMARMARPKTHSPVPGWPFPSLPALLALSDEEFRARFRGTALRRGKRRGLLRNAAIALGNRLAAAPHSGTGPANAGVGEVSGQAERAEGVAALERALNDSEPLVRGAAAWALGEAGGPGSERILQHAMEKEEDESVRREHTAALAQLRRTKR